jgi:2'-phosphotransferase
MASELNLNIRSDGYVPVDDLLKLSIQTFAKIPLKSHGVEEIKEVKYLTLLLLLFIY